MDLTSIFDPTSPTAHSEPIQIFITLMIAVLIYLTLYRREYKTTACILLLAMAIGVFVYTNDLTALLIVFIVLISGVKSVMKRAQKG